MKMKTILTAAALAASFGPLFAGGEGWTHDYEAAKKQAAEEEKNLLLDFTGSDWCPPCMRLTANILSKEAFREGVEDKLVLVELDFPQNEAKISEETKAQNAKLQEQYAIQGYPTLLLTDPEGKPFAQTGFRDSTPEEYVAHLEELLKAREARDEGFAKAEKLEGAEKAKALVAALNAMGLDDAMVANFYGDTVDAIKKADPDDESGYVKQMEMKAKLAEFETEVNGFARDQDHEGALALVEKTLESGDFEGEPKQQVAFYRAMILAHLKNFDDAIAALDEAKDIAPESELAGRLDGFKMQLEQAKQEEEAGGEEGAGEEEEAAE